MLYGRVTVLTFSVGALGASVKRDSICNGEKTSCSKCTNEDDRRLHLTTAAYFQFNWNSGSKHGPIPRSQEVEMITAAPGLPVKYRLVSELKTP